MTEFYCANFTAAKKYLKSKCIKYWKRKVENSNEELVNKKVRQIVPITPESIAEFLEGQGDFTKPHQLCKNEFNFQRKGRDETLRGIYDHIVERYFRIKKALDNGKCFSYKEDLRYDEAVTNVVNMLRNTVAVCITYNEHSAYYDFDEFVDDVERGLVMRILWSYFFDDRKLSWKNFCKKF
uniref:Uncharacterized protein n=1 Tax=Rhizophagus irregularis (strain DAOM 181602 / DAOM 197198 / MUCL 43194) TaxID=747089 RepID=U9SJJ4_RHIID